MEKNNNYISVIAKFIGEDGSSNLSAEEQEYRSRCLAYNISNGTSLTVSEYLEMTIKQMKNDEKREFKKSNRTVGLDEALVSNIKRRL